MSNAELVDTLIKVARGSELDFPYTEEEKKMVQGPYCIPAWHSREKRRATQERLLRDEILYLMGS